MNLTAQNTPAPLHPWLEELNSLYRVYLKVMVLKEQRDTLSHIELMGAWCYVGYGYVRDVWFNLTTASRIFNDRARELTLTARLIRYRHGTDQAKAAIAEYLCDQVLDQGDPDGNHC